MGHSPSGMITLIAHIQSEHACLALRSHDDFGRPGPEQPSRSDLAVGRIARSCWRRTPAHEQRAEREPSTGGGCARGFSSPTVGCPSTAARRRSINGKLILRTGRAFLSTVHRPGIPWPCRKDDHAS